MSDRVRVTVDAGRCVGSGTCVGIAPSSFVLDGGVAVPLAVIQERTEDLADAAVSCPVEAIHLEPVE